MEESPVWGLLVPGRGTQRPAQPTFGNECSAEMRMLYSRQVQELLRLQSVWIARLSRNYYLPANVSGYLFLAELWIVRLP